MKIHISQDGKIFANGQYVGFLEDDHVFMIVTDGPIEIGTFDHRSEVAAMVEKWLAEKFI